MPLIKDTTMAASGSRYSICRSFSIRTSSSAGFTKYAINAVDPATSAEHTADNTNLPQLSLAINRISRCRGFIFISFLLLFFGLLGRVFFLGCGSLDSGFWVQGSKVKAYANRAALTAQLATRILSPQTNNPEL